jgi:hypothetical protein
MCLISLSLIRFNQRSIVSVYGHRHFLFCYPPSRKGMMQLQIFSFYPFTGRHQVTTGIFFFYPLIDQVSGNYMFFYPPKVLSLVTFSFLYLFIGQIARDYRHLYFTPYRSGLRRLHTYSCLITLKVRYQAPTSISFFYP